MDYCPKKEGILTCVTPVARLLVWRCSSERWRAKDHIDLPPLLAGIAPSFRVKCAVRVSFSTQLGHVSESQIEWQE